MRKGLSKGGDHRLSRSLSLCSTRRSNWVQYNQNGEVFYIKNGDMSTKQDLPVRLVVYSVQPPPYAVLTSGTTSSVDLLVVGLPVVQPPEGVKELGRGQDKAFRPSSRGTVGTSDRRRKQDLYVLY